MEEVEQFVSFMLAYELKTFIDDVYEVTGVTYICDYEVTLILDYCIDNFSDNIYVLDHNERNTTTQENTSLLHEEENEEAIVPSKLGEEWDLPPSPPTCDDNSKSEYALDDGLFLLENPPCLENTMLCEDKNDKISGCNDALIHESPILFLKSPIHTIEEKYSYVEKYFYGVQLSYVYENSYSNHGVIIKSGTNNYFERGKHVNESLNKFSDPLYMPQFSKIHDSISHTINFSSSNCNYHERGEYKHPLYAHDNYKLYLPTIDMLWYTPIGCDSFIYKIQCIGRKLNFVITYCILYVVY